MGTVMLKILQRLESIEPASSSLTLPFALRQKARQRARLDDGREVALMLPRGAPLRGGDCLRAEDDSVIRIVAAAECVTTAFTKDPVLLARACYHLGNRHVALQIGDTWLRYLHDHVLDQLSEALGLRVFEEQAEFEPEAGAYSAGSAPLAHHGHEHSLSSEPANDAAHAHVFHRIG